MPGGRRDDERPKMRPVAGFVHADEDSHGAQYNESMRDVERFEFNKALEVTRFFSFFLLANG